jgi:hypothetical protein
VHVRGDVVEERVGGALRGLELPARHAVADVEGQHGRAPQGLVAVRKQLGRRVDRLTVEGDGGRSEVRFRPGRQVGEGDDGVDLARAGLDVVDAAGPGVRRGSGSGQAGPGQGHQRRGEERQPAAPSGPARGA